MSRKTFLTFLSLLFLATVSVAANKRFTLVIDPGHGGRDAGALGAISKEKDLNLAVALAFGKYVERNCPDVKVVYTRKTDVFITLMERANIANRNKADLFISVHTNSLPGGRIARGFQTYTLGRGRVSGSKRGIVENLDVAKRENSVIFMEKGYHQTYKGFDPNSIESSIMYEFIQDNNMERSVALAKLMQRNVCHATGRQDMGAFQDNLAVLRLSSMPGCLLELGFITTPDEERFLNAAGTADLYAQGIFNAFVAYKQKYYGGEIVVPYKAEKSAPANIPTIVPKKEEPVKEQKTTEQKPDTATVPAPNNSHAPEQTAQEKAATGSEPLFKVQILVCKRKLRPDDSHLKGLTNVDYYEENNLLKYTYGASNNYNEIVALRKQILESFPQAFIIAFKDGKRVDVNQAIKEYKTNKKK